MDKNNSREEKVVKGANGVVMLILLLILDLAALAAFGFSCWRGSVLGIALFTLLGFGLVPLGFAGLKIINPNEALVLALFGQYYGTIREAGFYWVNPFCGSINPTAIWSVQTAGASLVTTSREGRLSTGQTDESRPSGRKLSLKALTLRNDKQKINDELGNPVEIGVNVIWRIKDTAKAVFNVNNFKEYLSIQCDSALRNIVRSYPYDVSEQGDEKSLRGSSQEVAMRLKDELQEKVDIAGLEVLDVRITHLAYAPEIAVAMLQRQQAVAIIEARQKIVEGAVGMVEMALNRLSEKRIVDLDDERKAAMVSNLLVVLCGSKETQPVINSGSLY